MIEGQNVDVKLVSWEVNLHWCQNCLCTPKLINLNWARKMYVLTMNLIFIFSDINNSPQICMKVWKSAGDNMRSKQQPRPSYRWVNKDENGK